MINLSGTENLSNLIELEKVSLESSLDIQKNFNKQILIFVKKFMADIDFSLDSNDKAFFYLNESTSTLNKSNSNISILKNLLSELSQLNIGNENLINLVKDYNTNFKETMNSVYSNTETIEKFIHKITLTDFCELPNTSSDRVSEGSTCMCETSVTNTPAASVAENTLIISETQKKVFLPYKLDKVEDIMKNNARYHSVDEVINKLYTRPIGYYKFSPISRFKEAYKLVKEREKGSRFKALSLAFELLGNYSLHPAIISACKSIDELDIYLACLEENDLDDFKFFKIIYEIPLAVSKFAKSNI